MNIKERILETLKKEFEPLGYRYIKSESKFKRNVSKDLLCIYITVPATIIVAIQPSPFILTLVIGT